MSEQENSPTNRQYIIASYHYKSCQHYAEEHDSDKMLLHSIAAEQIISADSEEDWKQYRNFCIKNKITHYKYIR